MAMRLGGPLLAVKFVFRNADFQHVIGIFEEFLLVHVLDIAREIARILVFFLGFVGSAPSNAGKACLRSHASPAGRAWRSAFRVLPHQLRRRNPYGDPFARTV